MLDRLRQHRDYLEAEWQALQAAPLSRRKAMLVAALVDAYVDRLFAAEAEADDILVYRAEVAARSSALGLVMALCAGSTGLAIMTEAVAVPLTEYGALDVEDFMVSLYNNHSVQRLRLTLPDDGRRDMLEVLGDAIATLETP